VDNINYGYLLRAQLLFEGETEYVTRPAKTYHVGIFKYLRNTNLKYSLPHNSPVPDSSHVRFTREAEQGYSY